MTIRPDANSAKAPAARPAALGDFRRVRAAAAQPPQAKVPAGGDRLAISAAAQGALPNFLAPASVATLQGVGPNEVTPPKKGLIARFFDWLASLFNPTPAPLPPTPQPPVPQPPVPQPPVPQPPTPQPEPVRPDATPGVSVFFTNAYAGAVNGKTNAQAVAENEATTHADPNNPDKHLVALIDSVRPGGTLDGAFFSIGVDNVTEALCRAAQRGVKVRLVTEKEYYETPDGTALRPMIQKLKAAGIDVLPDDRGGLMHDKFLVANGQTVWTGSYNITEGGTYHENNNAMRIESQELARIYTHEFEKMYVHKNFGVDKPTNDNPGDDHPILRRVKLGNTEVEAFFSPFMGAQRGSKQAILDEIAKARTSVQFLAFSFHDDDIGNAMLAKAAQGVKVEGVFEKSQAAIRTSEYKRMNPQEGAMLGKLDVRIDTNPELMHHKVIIIDDHTLIMGSFNFSSNAQDTNDENMLVFRNAPDLVAKYREEFKRIQAISVA